MLTIMDAGAEDIQSSDDHFQVLTPVDRLEEVKKAIESAGIVFEQASLAWIPQNLLEVEGGGVEKILRLLEALEDLDDVQKVYSNFDIQEEELARFIA